MDPRILSYEPGMARQPDIPFSAASFRHRPHYPSTSPYAFPIGSGLYQGCKEGLRPSNPGGLEGGGVESGLLEMRIEEGGSYGNCVFEMAADYGEGNH